jgi:hypothetical protein
LESYLWARENHLLFGETNFDANGKCTMQDEKVRIFQLEMVLSSRSKDTVKIYSVLTTRWLEDIMASMREICKLYRKYIRVCSERKIV